MAVVPVDGAALMPSEFFVVWKDDVASVRNLYRERKYRRCTVLCSELLPKAVHPVFRTFLFFYQAVCYESLGHISHDYSTNKIPLFEQARDAFMSASETLPLPFLTTPDGRYDTPGASPVCNTLDVLEPYNNTSPSLYSEPMEADQTVFRARGNAAANPTTTDSADQATFAYTIPDFDEYSARHTIPVISPSLKPVEDDTIEDDQQLFLTARQRAASDHKARLSRSLSSQHALAEHLIPSPLFRTVPSSKKEPQSEAVAEAANPISVMTLSKPLPPTPINRPLPSLPSLPFNHQPLFVLKGKRFVIVPRRKTALATLISRFEGRSPFDSPTPADADGKEMVLFTSTPTTERFKRISATFTTKADEDPNIGKRALRELKNVNQKAHASESINNTLHNENSTSPDTPCPKPHHQQASQLPPSIANSRPPQSPATHLTIYNIHLTSLRTAIKTHITCTINAITKTRALQLAHEAEKRQRFANMHARHSATLDPSLQSPTKSRARDSEPVLAKDTRLRSFWSLQIRESCATPGVEEEKARERREKIERLRAGGWEGVRKESVGWKGLEYYEGIRRRAEEELRAGMGMEMEMGC